MNEDSFGKIEFTSPSLGVLGCDEVQLKNVESVLALRHDNTETAQQLEDGIFDIETFFNTRIVPIPDVFQKGPIRKYCYLCRIVIS
ncbi:hypothetical protein Vi05172_g2959 [Venturia inaequalis]|nr:hypothetical protein Vi05172_g2959 [Venturia inaequalis]